MSWWKRLQCFVAFVILQGSVQNLSNFRSADDGSVGLDFGPLRRDKWKFWASSTRQVEIDVGSGGSDPRNPLILFSLRSKGRKDAMGTHDIFTLGLGLTPPGRSWGRMTTLPHPVPPLPANTTVPVEIAWTAAPRSSVGRALGVPVLAEMVVPGGSGGILVVAEIAGDVEAVAVIGLGRRSPAVCIQATKRKIEPIRNVRHLPCPPLPPAASMPRRRRCLFSRHPLSAPRRWRSPCRAPIEWNSPCFSTSTTQLGHLFLAGPVILFSIVKFYRESYSTSSSYLHDCCKSFSFSLLRFAVSLDSHFKCKT